MADALETRYWHRKAGERRKAPDIDNFLNELDQLCRKYDVLIEHEDSGGGFIIVRGYRPGGPINEPAVSEDGS